MAILDLLSVEVISDGDLLREYDVPADEPVDDQHLKRRPTQHITKYIEAISRADYKVVCSAYVDGRFSTGVHVMKEKYRRHNWASETLIGSRANINGVWKRFPFHWSEINTSEETPKLTVAEIKDLYGGIGTIRVDVWRRRGTKTRSTTHSTFSTVDETIPEKALKGKDVDVLTKFGNPYDTKAPKVLGSTSLDSTPIAAFVFKYRSRRALQIIGVIPRSPSPIPLEDRDLLSLSREEAVELIRRQRAQIEAATVKVKKEDDTKRMGTRATVKREAPDSDDGLSIIAGPTKKARKAIETIDLTDC